MRLFRRRRYRFADKNLRETLISRAGFASEGNAHHAL